jgi:phage gpG-like protein
LKKNIHNAVVKKSMELALRLEAYVKENKLSGQVLNVRSGNLRRSIQSKVTQSIDDKDVVDITVYSDGSVPYADIHEYGGHTPPHIITPVQAQALSFIYEGKRVFAKIVHHPGSIMPERSYLRTSIAEMTPTIRDEIENTVNDAIQQGLR